MSFRAVAGFAGIALVVFAATYPTHFLIADEVAYFEQALEWGNGSSSAVSDYPPGTALFAAGFVALFGPKAVFWCGIGAFLSGIWALAGLLRRLNKPLVWALYPALCLPCLVLTRTLMSDLPSFALACIFLWLFVQPIKQPAKQVIQFIAGLMAGLGILFRETNLLWALPFVVSAVLYRREGWKMLWLGFVAGLLPRLVWGWFAFENPFFVRDSGIAFSLSYLPKNLVFYLFTLLVLMPGGLYFLIKNKSPYRWEIAVAALLFLGVYGCYGYDAFAKSGWKGLVLQGRFLLPLLPLVTLAAAETQPMVGKKIQIGLATAAVLFLAMVQVAGHAYNLEQQRITSALLQIPAQTHLTFTPGESRKFLNALHGPQTLLVPAQNTIPGLRDSTQNCFAHLITRSDSADRVKKTAEAETAFQRYFHGAKTTLVTDLTIRDGTRLRIWRVGQTDHDE